MRRGKGRLLHVSNGVNTLRCTNIYSIGAMMKKHTLAACLAMAATTSQLTAQEMGDDNCDSLYLVSSWFNNSVKIYDGCSGEFVRDLDLSGNISGPQKVLETPDGEILVVSENNARIVKYDRETLSEAEVMIDNSNGSFINTPVAAVYDENNNLYVASYSQNKVVKVDTNTWQVTDTILQSNASSVRGADSGIALNGDYLYIPGYDSDNIVRVHIDSKNAETFIAQGRNGMDAPRGIMFDGNRMLVTSERSNSIMVFNVNDGSFVETLYTANLPAGIVRDGEQHFLFTTRQSVARAAIDGSGTERVVANQEGGLNGATNVLRIMKSGVDSDGDGLSDEDENNRYGTDPDNPDSDEDGLSDGEEVNTTQTDPLNSDSDGDLMPDGFEVNNDLDPLQADATQDPDSDGLNNLAEYQIGTNPQNPDTDGDGIPDGSDSNPLISDSVPIISGSPDEQVDQDVAYTFVPSVEYPGNMENVSFSIQNKPDWAEFNSTDGQLSGQPNNSNVGTYTDILITSTDGTNGDELPPFSIEVVNVNDAPRLRENAVAGDIVAIQNAAISRDIAQYVEDIDEDDNLTFSSQSLPSGLALSEQGMLSGSVSQTGTYSLVVVATDTAGESVSVAVNLVVNQSASKQDNDSGSSGGSLGFIWLLATVFCIGARRQKHCSK